MVASLKSVDYETRLAILDLFSLEYRRLLILTYALFEQSLANRLFTVDPADTPRGHTKASFLSRVARWLNVCSPNLLTERLTVETRPLHFDFCLDLSSLAVSQSSCFLRVAWQLGTEKGFLKEYVWTVAGDSCMAVGEENSSVREDFMDCASTLSKGEVSTSLREVAKRSRKNFPVPRYICTPTSDQLQQRVPVLFSSNPVFIPLINATKVHGHIPELDNPPSPKAMRHSFMRANEGVAVPKLSSLRRLESRKLRSEWLYDSEHRAFWSHVIFGVNKVMRLLETSEAKMDVDKTSINPKLACVLVDGGWVASPLGHHIARLCSTFGVRLVSVKPLKSLASMFSTPFRTIKKACAFHNAIAIGICLSASAPNELQAWFASFCTTVPLLDQPIRRVRDSGSEAAPSHLKGDAMVIDENGEPWDQYPIDATKLYVFDADSYELPTEQVLSLPELRSYLSSYSTLSLPLVYSAVEDNHTAFLSELATQGNHTVEFQPTVLKVMKPQEDAERRSRKKKKRKKVKKSARDAVTT
ncbi:hypothetical protein T265_08175 [Opisthorchis viverrini]|uniref:Uncharacterized protein n=1 Tax=Opisthorchis viverrini TaxID=6198 RepID=A0A074ZA05_OPIVI|nr:hypothetical protein T265_08175 [Opisthorchis viverrini]KER24086.1 hypothetical protein T265_08175 [Opisthorchis viverrini]